MFINIYQGYPNAGLKDGTVIDSESTLPIGPLDAASSEESEPYKLAVRCSLGYQVMGYTYIELLGDTKNYWSLADDKSGSPDIWQPYGGRLVITSRVTDVNHIFWVKAKASSSEPAKMDTDTNIIVKAILGKEE